jgi:hypothetical protein
MVKKSAPRLSSLSSIVVDCRFVAAGAGNAMRALVAYDSALNMDYVRVLYDG